MLKKAAAILIGVSILFSIPVSVAAEENLTVTRTQNYTTTNKNQQADFEKEIVQDNQAYTLDKVLYEILEQHPVEQPQTITETKITSNLTQQQVDDTIQSETYSDITLYLADVRYETVQLPQTITVTETTDFGYQPSQPSAPNTKELTYTDTDGSQKTVTAPLLSITNTAPPSMRQGYTITGRYYGDDDVKYYMFGNTKINANADGSVPYRGYESVILSDLGLDSNNVRIDSAAWSGTDQQNGQTVKYANFNCSRMEAPYTATYSISVPATGYTATATYTAIANLPTEQTEYTIKATAMYQKSSSPFVIIAAGTILLLGLLAVFILFLLKRKRRRDET